MAPSFTWHRHAGQGPLCFISVGFCLQVPLGRQSCVLVLTVYQPSSLDPGSPDCTRKGKVDSSIQTGQSSSAVTLIQVGGPVHAPAMHIMKIIYLT